MGKSCTRRGFLGRSLGTAVGIGLAGKALGAEGQAPPSDAIRMGFIGIGAQGGGHLHSLAAQKDVQVAGISDVTQPRLDAALKRYATAKGHHDFRELLDRQDVDAVVIATPPHWHALMCVHAAKAGKDFYVEKPMTLHVGEIVAVVRAVREHGRITQVGTQIHEGANYRRVVEIVRSGVLGPINCVRTFNHVGQTLRGLGKPPDGPVPAGLDWELWVGPAPMRPYNPMITASAYQHCSFMDFSGGWMPGMAPHIVDLPVWALDLGLPTMVSCAGGRFVIDDVGDAPDVQEALFQYPKLVMTWMSNMTSSYGFDFQGGGGRSRRLGIYFHGEQATLFTDYGRYVIVPEDDPKKQPELPPSSLPPSPGHHREWLDGIKTRRQPSCNVAYHHRVNVPICLANLSLKVGRGLRFDPATETIVGDPEAARLMMPVYREPWKLG